MKGSKGLNRIIEKLIDFGNISVGFKAEFKDKKSKKIYVLTENENGYLLEKKGKQTHQSELKLLRRYTKPK